MKQKFVIDANNVVIFSIKASKKVAQLSRLLNLMREIKQIGDVLPIASAELKYRIDDVKALKSYISQGIIIESPPYIDTDEYLLETTGHLNAYIVSNDHFRPYQKEYQPAINRRLPFMFVKDDKGEFIPILPWVRQIGVVS